MNKMILFQFIFNEFFKDYNATTPLASAAVLSIPQHPSTCSTWTANAQQLVIKRPTARTS